MSAPAEISIAIAALNAGQNEASETLLALVYGEMRSMAAAYLARLPPGQTLQPTVLVHDAYMKLAGASPAAQGWEGRRHFFGAASRAMRQLIVDHVRAKRAVKRGGDRTQETWTADLAPAGDMGNPEDVLAIDQALDKLAAEHPGAAEVVSLAYFGGLTHEEIADVLQINTRTVERKWQFARAWLFDALSCP